MNERERFEKWARGKLQLDFLRHRTGGGYFLADTQAAWEAWQAAKAEAAERERALVAEVKAAMVKAVIGELCAIAEDGGCDDLDERLWSISEGLEKALAQHESKQEESATRKEASDDQ